MSQKRHRLRVKIIWSSGKVFFGNVGGHQRRGHPFPVHLQVVVDNVVQHPLPVPEEPSATQLARHLATGHPPKGAELSFFVVL